MTLSNIAELFSGVAFFLFGMHLMGDHLKQAAGSRLEAILYRLTGSPVSGVLFGAGVAAMIQSSSAVSVMAVGLVNADVMSVRQAISVILGSILGTSATGWLLSLSSLGSSSGVAALFSTEMLTCIAAVLGIVLVMRSKNQHVGHILLGFAILMVGMDAMSDAVRPLREQAAFIRVLSSISNPALGIIVGAIFTAILQSASAAVGILQAMTLAGTIPFSAAFPLIMGISIGAAAPVLLAAVSASTRGKRAALFYLVGSAAGVLVIAVPFYLMNSVLHFGWMAQVMTSAAVALLNTLLRLAIVLILLPLLSPLERLLEKLVPDRTP